MLDVKTHPIENFLRELRVVLEVGKHDAINSLRFLDHELCVLLWLLAFVACVNLESVLCFLASPLFHGFKPKVTLSSFKGFF
ncbi:Uncharacterised protein [Chlamydia trachomatis]|nr:Uncharacterised protein [Chlamydia trachomatis]